MTTSLDEPRVAQHKRIMNQFWLMLGILLGLVLAMTVLVSMMVEVDNDKYVPTEKVSRASCDWTISSYEHGGPKVKQRLEQQYQACQ